jgi:hypothetical protein
MTWGNPHRGLVQGGALAMLGGITRSAQQPSGDGQRDSLGGTLLQRGPAAAVARAPEELVDDAARGYEWRTDAIISGGNMDLYGQTIGGFVYCAPDGSRWLIEAAHLPTVTTTQPLNLSLTAKRFGDFGPGTVETRTLTATLASIGQADADPLQSVGTLADMVVCDIKPDGSRAMIMLYLPGSVLFSWGEGQQEICRHPLGWLELTIGGGVAGLTANVSVLRTRTQTLGSQSVIFGNWSGAGSFQLAGQVTTSEDFGTHRIDTTTWAPGTGGVFNYAQQTLAENASFAGRILALWYSTVGLDEVTLELSYTASGGNQVPTETTSGRYVLRVDAGPSPTSTVLEDTLYQRVNRSGAINSSLAVRLKRNGAEIDGFTGTASNASELQRVLVDSQGGAVGAWRTETGSGTIDGQSSAIVESMPITNSTPFFDPILSGRMSPAFSGSSTNLARAAALSAAWGGEIFMTAWVRCQTTPRRYSNNLIGLAISSGPYDFTSGIYQYVYRTGAAATPAGVDNGGLVSGANGKFYGSYNPATGQVIRDQSNPVCWI